MPAAVVADDAAAPPTGVFIALEGGEGTGKSTQATALADALRALGYDVVLTREPGDSRIGGAIRALLLDPSNAGLSDRAEALLYAADRAEHVESVVLPALRRGAIVVTDRYVDSSLAYQGAGRPLELGQVERVNEWATHGLLPRLTIVLDLEPRVGLRRAGDDPDRLEAEPVAFHRRVRDAYRALAARDPHRYLVVDAAQSPDSVKSAILAAVTPLLPVRQEVRG
jgi:dTMP kinase